MKMAEQQRDTIVVLSNALHTMCSDELIPIEIREQYERLVLAELRQKGLL